MLQHDDNTIDGLFESVPDDIHDAMENCEGIVSMPDGEARLMPSVEHNAIIVAIDTALCEAAANAAGDIGAIDLAVADATLTVSTAGSAPILKLTWREARQLSAALWQIANVAEFG